MPTREIQTNAVVGVVFIGDDRRARIDHFIDRALEGLAGNIRDNSTVDIAITFDNREHGRLARSAPALMFAHPLARLTADVGFIAFDHATHGLGRFTGRHRFADAMG
jgi:hypothetical protein